VHLKLKQKNQLSILIENIRVNQTLLKGLPGIDHF
jgi:hypothetical protein